ncbi:MAG: hypothetical protein M0D54_19655 [Hyphomonadaceae bacterium JAD_PAG50586_4]|nr:MAG: hypothetical protein M0D54_19655 [Hyphomonadaceae bacterium JAD_PAG50586_4]
MLHVFDEAYTETRRVLEGLAETKPPYTALMEWIAQQTEGISVLNVVYWMLARSKPCLTVVFERQSDVIKFAGDDIGSRELHARIIAKFREILIEQRNTKIVTENIFVILAAFAEVERVVANEKVPPEAVFAFQHSLADPSIWLMQPRGGALRVFFHTDSQLAASEQSGIRDKIAEGGVLPVQWTPA